MKFGTEKLDWCGYPMVTVFLTIWLLVLTQYTNMTDSKTDRRTGRARLCIASHGRNAAQTSANRLLQQQQKLSPRLVGPCTGRRWSPFHHAFRYSTQSKTCEHMSQDVAHRSKAGWNPATNLFDTEASQINWGPLDILRLGALCPNSLKWK